MPPSGILLLNLVIMVMAYMHPSQAVQIEVNPAVINEMVTQKLSVTCVCDGSDYWIKNVVTLKLGKKGQEPIALYSQGGVSTGAGMKHNIKAEGHIEKDASKSFLRLTIKNPGVDDMGTYVCQVYYVDEASLLMKDEIAEANITINNEDTSTILANLMKEMSDLKETVQQQGIVIQKQTKLMSRQKDNVEKQENTTKTTNAVLQEKVLFLESRLDETNDIVNQQKNTICNQELKQNDQEMKLKEQEMKLKGQDMKLKENEMKLKGQEMKLKDQEMKFKDLESVLEQQNQSFSDHTNILDGKFNELFIQQAKLSERSVFALSRIHELDEKEKNDIQSRREFIKKESVSSAFFARYTNEGPLTVGHILKFKEVLENIGNDFNKDTGLYTVPVDGLYVFNLFAMSYIKGSRILVAVQTSDKILAVLLVEHATDVYDQSSVSAVIKLKADQKVWCQVHDVNRVGNRLHNSVYTGLAGYLIRPF